MAKQKMNDLQWFIDMSQAEKKDHLLEVAKLCIDGTPSNFARKVEIYLNAEKTNLKYRVTFLESEIGWGQNIFTTDYDTREEAEVAIERVNSENTSSVAPDYYIQAYEKIEVLEVDE